MRLICSVTVDKYTTKLLSVRNFDLYEIDKVCEREGFADYTRRNPLLGMPYAMPNLTRTDLGFSIVQPASPDRPKIPNPGEICGLTEPSRIGH
jgi:hypothetical protein